MALRIAFCGTPAFAVPSLRYLIAQPEFHIEAVVTQPDRPRGRGQEMATSPVKEAALAAGIPVFQPEKIQRKRRSIFSSASRRMSSRSSRTGRLFPQRLIDIPRLGWINLHASLLPKYRGAAPINWAIVNGETRTGVTTMQIDAGLDTGPMLLKYETEIGADETAPELMSRLAEAGAPLMAETLRGLDRGAIQAVAQDSSEANVRAAIEKRRWPDRLVLDAQTIYNRMRGLHPWPGRSHYFAGRAVISGANRCDPSRLGALRASCCPRRKTDYS